jgi:uncharacterized alkaline shock family protein YloU
MEVNHSTEDYTLPCGRRLEDLWELLESSGEPDAHQQTCPHCRTARGSLVALRDASRELATEPVTVPAGLTGRIMSAVRAEVRRTSMVSVPGERGPVRISEQAIAVVLRFAADQVEGVRARRCTVTAHPDAPPGVIDVELSIALRYGTGPADQVLAAVRSSVTSAASSGIGVRLASCDLRVEDIYE